FSAFPTATGVVVSNAVPGNGGVIISWAAPVAVVSLSASPNPAVAGQVVTLTATVAGPTSAPVPTGNVTFVDYTTGGVAIGLPVELSGGTASTTTSSLPVGDTQLYAHYSGDATYAPVTSSLLTEDVLPLTWSAGPSGPSARSGPAMATSPSGLTLLFGGAGAGSTAHSDTWELASPTGTWQELAAAASTAPSARTVAAMVWDPEMSEFVLFGGVSHTGYHGGTWAFDSATATWSELATTGSPSPRAGAAMAALPNGDIVLFGGLGSSGFLGGTWVFDPTTTTWSEQSGPGPSARYSAAMAADGAGNVVLFGGLGPSGYESGTWSYNPTAGTWSEVATSGAAPTGRFGASFAYGPSAKGFVLFGGEGTAGFSSATYSYDPATATWAALEPSVSPTPRDGAAMSYDPPANVFVLFGGWTGSNYLSGTWELPG
ncbi:MAG: Kelch repeat-containing protein, partial [Acidimicrobiales bacterium]